MIFPRHIHVEDPSQPGEARRVVTSLCNELGFNELRTAQVCLVVTELATNLVKHTHSAGGDLIFTPIEEDGVVALDILALDQAGGILNIGESLRDGYSTASTAGGGLGAIRRQSSEFDIYSAPNQGTVRLSRIRHQTKPEFSVVMQMGSVCLPVSGEQVCGDAWAICSGVGSTFIMLADGLGHGPQAAEAANLAVATFKQFAPRRPVELVQLISRALSQTRGAAVAVVEIALRNRMAYFAGVGNISGAIFDENRSFNLISHNGTAGIGTVHVKEFTYPWPEHGLLIMHSDGIATHWSLDDYPGLSQKHPALIAGVLFRDHQRLTDDSCIVVAKEIDERRTW
jgi:anti-sigma regulatory factor (Ser/Thr protein kinase)